MPEYVIGVDFGSDSARAVLVDCSDGSTVASSTELYPRWAEGLFCDAGENRFRHHPLDYMECLEKVLKDVASACPDRMSVRGIGVDTTASTPCFVDEHCTPLSLKEAFKEDPDAMFVLWKDHTALQEAEQINYACKQADVDYTSPCGFHYSPEAYWSKVLHILRRNEAIRAESRTAIELCDWIPALLTGCDDIRKLRTSHCAAGCKQLYSELWGGWPPKGLFVSIDPILGEVWEHLPERNYGCDEAAGTLSAKWVEKLGLSTDVTVGVGNVDAHSGGIGGGVRHKTLVMNIGTSACYMTTVPNEIMGERMISGVYGQIKDGILRGSVGYEVSLSAFGDVFAWFRRLLSTFVGDEKTVERILPVLAEQASHLRQRLDAVQATDYFNGRRTPDPDNFLTASITGLKITTSAAEIYYALVEAVAFATKSIVDFMAESNVPLERFVAIGGISQKSPFVMQMLADVLGRELEVSSSADCCALGAAIQASVAAGLYPDTVSAQKAMCRKTAAVYRPDPSKAEIFTARYLRYKHISKNTLR